MPIAKRPVTLALVAAALAVSCTGTTVPTAGTSIPETSTTMTTTTTTQASTCPTGDGVNDACSCDADAHAYCSGFYSSDWQSYARANGYTTASWKYGLLDCLGKQPVSTSCKTSLARREALNAQMMAACGTYCKGTSPQPGAEPCVDHLKSIYASLDNACRVALDAHEAAKAIDGKSGL